MGIFNTWPLRERLRERAVGGFSPHVYLFADVPEPGISEQRPGQQPALAQNLEAVADAQHQSASRGKPFYRLHHR